MFSTIILSLWVILWTKREWYLDNIEITPHLNHLLSMVLFAYYCNGRQCLASFIIKFNSREFSVWCVKFLCLSKIQIWYASAIFLGVAARSQRCTRCQPTNAVMNGWPGPEWNRWNVIPMSETFRCRYAWECQTAQENCDVHRGTVLMAYEDLEKR